VDTIKWKHIKQTENAAVYHARDHGERASSASIVEGSGRRDTHRSLPSFLTVGKVPDALDDILYSLTAPTREATIIQTGYVNPSITDVEVLHVIRRPTPEDPFSQLTIKWLLLQHSPMLAPRDYVFIDAHGSRILPDGQRVGYRFSHTIELAGAGPMTDRGFVRSNFSESSIFREDQSNGPNVHEYARLFFAPAGAIPTKVFAALVAMHISSTVSQGRIGECKKLALALRRKETGKWTVAAPHRSTQKSECGMCSKKLTMMNKSRADCALCGRRLCFSCRVRKEIRFLTGEFTAERLRVAFCALCVQQAIKLPSYEVAAEEFLTPPDGFYRMPESLRPAESMRRGWFSV
jgi:hypothetical protein